MDRNLRIEVLVKKILDMDTYIREMMKLNLAEMKRIKHNRRRVIKLDESSSEENTDEENKANAADDCEHDECHAVTCKYPRESDDEETTKVDPSEITQHITNLGVQYKMKIAAAFGESDKQRLMKELEERTKAAKEGKFVDQLKQEKSLKRKLRKRTIAVKIAAFEMKEAEDEAKLAAMMRTKSGLADQVTKNAAALTNE